MRAIAAIVLVGCCGCGSNPSAEPDASTTDGSPIQNYRFEIVDRPPYVAGTRTFAGQRVRVIRPDGKRTYLHFLLSDKAGPRPVIVITQPYAGADWSGDEVDNRWAGYFQNRPNPKPGDSLFFHQDIDGSADPSMQVIYENKPLATAQAEALPELLNDFSVVHVYGRFYSGGSVRDDIEDMRAAMWFVAEQADIDHARVGVVGGSWGGFEALYASAYGDTRVRPLATVAMYPPADFPSMELHFRTVTGDALNYLRPYVSRIHASTGGPAQQTGTNYQGLTFGELCPGAGHGLPAKTLVLHDENDNLVPVSQSQQLGQRCGASTMYWPRQSPIDTTLFSHGKILDPIEQPGIQAVATYGYSYLFLALATPEQPYVFYFYSPVSLRNHLNLLRLAQMAGKDVSYAAPRLLDLCNPKLLLIETPPDSVAGASALATAVNAVWATQFTAATVCSSLRGGLPQP
jgi:pimeloyl-ACP methyl ester carboxylesterase